MKKYRSIFILLTALVVLALMPAGAYAKKVNHDLVKTETHYGMVDGKERVTFTSSYTYDKKGRTKKDVSVFYNYDENGNVDKTKTVYTYTYNKKGQNTGFMVVSNGEKQSKLTYSYKKGKLSKMTFYYWNGKKWDMEDYTVYKHTSKKTVRKSYNKDKKLTSTATDTLNKQGLITKTVYKSTSGYAYTTTYKYNKKGFTTKRSEVSTYPGGGKETYNYAYAYDKYGRTTKEVFSGSGGVKTTTTNTYKGAFKKNKSCPLQCIQKQNGTKTGRTVYTYTRIKY